jgi:hypothetical protein
MDKICLQVCERTNKEYQNIRNRHYIENNGTHGQQIHFLIYKNDEIIGIISGASSVYSVKNRDLFFNIPKEKQIKQNYYLPAIINNTVFRLENHERNLGTQILSLWRNTCAFLWYQLYNVQVIGFETFVIEKSYRKGTVYKADNWTCVGETSGSTKKHIGLKNKHTRQKTEQKLIYCRWINMKQTIPTIKYQSSWRKETIEEKERAKKIQELRKKMVGMKFEYDVNIELQYNQQIYVISKEGNL